MHQSIVPNGDYALETQLARQMAQQLQELALAGTLARQGLREIHTASRYAAERHSQTLRSAQQVIETAIERKGLSSLQQAALYHYTQAYLYEMLLLADQTGDALITKLENW